MNNEHHQIGTAAARLADRLPHSVMVAVADAVAQHGGLERATRRQAILQSLPTPDFRDATADFIDRWHSHAASVGSEAVAVALLLIRRLGVRTVHGDDRLTEEMILAWADAHHAATGKWPKWGSPEPIEETGRKWSSIDDALRRGHRGLPGGDSLTELLARNGRPVKVQKRH
jgi:hypothetical protein